MATQTDQDSFQFRPPFVVDSDTGVYTTTVKSPTGIPTDPPLTSYGVEQSQQLASHLLQVSPEVDQVYSSPFFRCLQTISPFVRSKNEYPNASEAHAFDIRVERGLGEWFGMAPFEHPAAAPLTTLHALVPEIDVAYLSQASPSNCGESLPQLHNRVAAVMDAIVRQSDEEGHKSVVVCSHAAVIIAIGRVLTGSIPEHVEEEDFYAFTCGLSTYRRSTGKTEPGSSDGVRETNGVLQASMPQGTRSAGTESAGIANSHPGPISRDKAESSWKDGIYAKGGWICESNSDCTFLRGGAERGWRFSGDEAFNLVDRGGVPDNDARGADGIERADATMQERDSAKGFGPKKATDESAKL